MNRDTARAIMQSIKTIDSSIVELSIISDAMEDEQEKKSLRTTLVEIVGKIYDKIIMDIIKQYPDLDPDKNLRETL